MYKTADNVFHADENREILSSHFNMPCSIWTTQLLLF